MSVRNLTISAGAVAAAFIGLFLVLGLYYQKGLVDYADLSDSASRLGSRLDRIAVFLDGPYPQNELAEEIKKTDLLFDSVLKDLSSTRIPRDKDPALASGFKRASAEWKDARSDLRHDSYRGDGRGLKNRLLNLSEEVLSLSPLIKEDTLAFVRWYTKAAVIFSMVSIGVIWYAALFVIFRILAPMEEATKKAAVMNSSGAASGETQGYGAPYYLELKALVDQYERLSGNLNESRVHYSDLVDTIPEALVETDRLGKITFINEAARALTGYSEKDLIGRDYTDLFPPDATPAVREIFDAVMNGGTLKNREFPIILKDGKVRYFEFSDSPVRAGGRGGGVTGCRFVGRDIDERKRIMDELKKAKKESEETSAKLKRTVEDLEEFALLAVRRELKMHEIRERFKKLMEERHDEG